MGKLQNQLKTQKRFGDNIGTVELKQLKNKSRVTEAKSSRLKPTLSKWLSQGEMGHGGTLYLYAHWDLKRLKVCVWHGPPAKPNLKMYPRACARCIYCPLYPLCPHPGSNCGSHAACYTLQSGSIGDQGYTFVQQLDKDKGAQPLIQQFTSPQS